MKRHSALACLTTLAFALVSAACQEEKVAATRGTPPATPIAGQPGIRTAVATALALTEGDLDEDPAPPSSEDGDLAAFRSVCNETAMDALNQSSGDFAIPAPPALPASAGLPAACDESVRRDAVVEACGALTEASGATLAEAAASCVAGTTCHIVLPAGEFDGRVDLGCVILEGAGPETSIHGGLTFSAPSVLARVSVDDGYGAVGTTADLLVNEATLSAGYEGLGFAWDADLDVAVCRSRVAGGYSGVAQSWGSERLTVAGNSIAACYEAVASSWGSSGLHVTQNLLLAGYVGVHIHNSLASAIVGNTIYGEYQAVSVFSFEDDPEFDYDTTSAGVLISGNSILNGSLPESDPEHEILVENND